MGVQSVGLNPMIKHLHMPSLGIEPVSFNLQGPQSEALTTWSLTPSSDILSYNSVNNLIRCIATKKRTTHLGYIESIENTLVVTKTNKPDFMGKSLFTRKQVLEQLD